MCACVRSVKMRSESPPSQLQTPLRALGGGGSARSSAQGREAVAGVAWSAPLPRRRSHAPATVRWPLWWLVPPLVWTQRCDHQRPSPLPGPSEPQWQHVWYAAADHRVALHLPPPANLGQPHTSAVGSSFPLTMPSPMARMAAVATATVMAAAMVKEQMTLGCLQGSCSSPLQSRQRS